MQKQIPQHISKPIHNRRPTFDPHSSVPSMIITFTAIDALASIEFEPPSYQQKNHFHNKNI